MYLDIKNQSHGFHLVAPSIHPILTAFSLFVFTSGIALFAHGFAKRDTVLALGTILFLFCIYNWTTDVTREATFLRNHTTVVTSGIKIGIFLFLLSEFLIFFSLFWALGHNSLAPAVEFGSSWPPLGFEAPDVFGVPLYNSALLASTGCRTTLIQHALIAGDRKSAIAAISTTVVLLILFFANTTFEFTEWDFSINDRAYATQMVCMIRVHTTHVLVSAISIVVFLARLIKGHIGQKFTGWSWASLYLLLTDCLWVPLFIALFIV